MVGLEVEVCLLGESDTLFKCAQPKLVLSSLCDISFQCSKW